MPVAFEKAAEMRSFQRKEVSEDSDSEVGRCFSIQWGKLDDR